MVVKISYFGALRGEIFVPADKSISHRAVMLGAIAKGRSRIHHLLLSEDVKATMAAFQALGTSLSLDKDELVIEGRDFHFSQPEQALNMGNSGTTTRLLMGILAGQKFQTQLIGDASLSKRPMARVIRPLTLMGAEFSPSDSLPLSLWGGDLTAIDYQLPVASAQVKSALIFAALQAQGQTHLTEKELTRNHTEQMLPLFGGELSVEGKEIFILGKQKLSAAEFTVPGDISSAAFWIVAALIIPGSEIILKNLGINHTRTGILKVIQAMGGKFELLNIDEAQESADVHVIYTRELRAINIEAAMIPSLVDELPIIALLATQAEGESHVSGAEDLRHKESDRIHRVVELLGAMGANIQENLDGWTIKGKTSLKGSSINEPYDHRIQMMAVIAGLTLEDDSLELENISQIATSYPNFFKDLEKLCQSY